MGPSKRGAIAAASLLAVAAVVSCGKGASKEAPPAEAPPVATPAADAARALPEEPAARPEVTAEARKAYAWHLRAGRALTADKKWGEAVRELEAALAAIPMDARALSELGWAAFQAGDYARARAASADSVRAATDSDIEAASLYNLGRVAEAAGQPEEAARHYRASLELRPNALVSRHLAGLGKQAPAAVGAPADLLCARPRPRAAVCPCLEAAARASLYAEPGERIQCARRARGVAGLEVATVASEREEWAYLIGESSAGWATVALLGRAYRPGKFGIEEELAIDRVEPRRVGDRVVLWIEARHSHSSFDAVTREEEARVRTLVTLCVVPTDDAAAIRCPLELPIFDDYTRQRSDEAEPDDVPDDDMPDDLIEELATPGLPIREVVQLRLDLADDGTATLILVDGPRTPQIEPLLGPHRLW